MPNSKFLTLEKKGYGKKALKCGHDFIFKQKSLEVVKNNVTICPLVCVFMSTHVCKSLFCFRIEQRYALRYKHVLVSYRNITIFERYVRGIELSGRVNKDL